MTPDQARALAAEVCNASADIVARLRMAVDPTIHEYEYARKGEREEAAKEIERLRFAEDRATLAECERCAKIADYERDKAIEIGGMEDEVAGGQLIVASRIANAIRNP